MQIVEIMGLQMYEERDRDGMELDMVAKTETQGAALRGRKGGGFPGATDSTGVDEGPWQKVLCVRVYECMRHNKSCKGAEWPGKGLEASGLRSLGIGMDLSRDVIPILPLTKPLATSVNHPPRPVSENQNQIKLTLCEKRKP